MKHSYRAESPIKYSLPGLTSRRLLISCNVTTGSKLLSGIRPTAPTSPLQSTQRTQATQRVHRTQATHATQPRKATDRTLSTDPAMPAESRVNALPAVPTTLYVRIRFAPYLTQDQPREQRGLATLDGSEKPQMCG